MQFKLSKYRYAFVNKTTTRAQILDPLVSNDGLQETVKHELRQVLVHQYGLSEKKDDVSAMKPQVEDDFSFSLKAFTANADKKIVSRDELDEFFDFTKVADTTCKDVLYW